MAPKKSYSEEVLENLLVVQQRDRGTLFEACITYCSEEAIDVEDLVENLDEYSKGLLRQCALEERRVRQSFMKKEDALQFE